MLSEDMVDSFNLPLYNSTKQELGSLIEINVCFSIEGMEPLVTPARNIIGMAPSVLVLKAISCYRGALEQVIEGHFGNHMTDELFNQLKKKFVDSFSSQPTGKQILELYVLLKRKLD